tara:strand:- start:487 stop:861 length:375 start_codon:yes stop_codon:yes gene_type:complete
MAQIKLTFDQDLNSSLQVGDTIWYVLTSDIGGYETALTSNNSFEKLGVVAEISPQYTKPIITVDLLPNFISNSVSTNTFIMFSKNKTVNSDGLKGYYAELEFSNNSNKRIELFSIGSEINESSK